MDNIQDEINFRRFQNLYLQLQRFGVKSGVKQELIDSAGEFYLNVKTEYTVNGMSDKVRKDIWNFCGALTEGFKNYETKVIHRQHIDIKSYQ